MERNAEVLNRSGVTALWKLVSLAAQVFSLIGLRGGPWRFPRADVRGRSKLFPRHQSHVRYGLGLHMKIHVYRNFSHQL